MGWMNPLIETGAISTLDTTFGAYEKFVLRSLLLSFISGKQKDGRMRATEEFLQWYGRYAAAVGIKIPQLDAASRNVCQGKSASQNPLVRIPRASIANNRSVAPVPSALQKRLDWVAQTLKLDARDACSLSAVCRLTQLEPFRSFSAAVSGHDEERDEVSVHLIGSLLGIRGSVLRKIFDNRGQLMQLGLIEDRGAADYAPSEMLLKLLRRRTTDPRVLQDALIGEPVEPTLELSDFDHMGQAREDVIRILDGSLKQQAEGVGLLFYGPPGTGKTEFAALLAEACDARVVFAGEMDDDQREPHRADRLAHLSLLSAIGNRAGRVIVVVDEADDIFTGVDEDEFSNRTGSKVFVNRLVENCAVPTIWITNHPRRFGEAVLRRMLRAVEFTKPGKEVRKRIVDRHADVLGMALDVASRDCLAGLSASPAVIASGLRAASFGSGGGEMAISSALSIQKALGENEPPQPLRQAVPFAAALSSASVDLVALEQRVVEAGAGALSFLFTGLPGTGKTAFARHLADRLGMDVLQKRGSDLLGKYVGQTEENISRAFQEAAESGLFLIFDEADSLLFDRRHASRSWELSQVNEMLTWMEVHPLPFAATSNLLDQLDPAVQRRFLFKAQFGAMSPTQIEMAFQRHFGCAASLEALRLNMVTPGDFAVVARKATVLRVTDPAELAGMLAAEVAIKPGGRKAIGFV